VERVRRQRLELRELLKPSWVLSAATRRAISRLSGDTVTIAARLGSRALPDELLVSRTIWH
jgi:hypothetical protein